MTRSKIRCTTRPTTRHQIRRPTPLLKLAALLAMGPALGAACGGSTDPADPQPTIESGRISLPLLASSNQHSYRLTNVFIQVYGPQFTQLSSNGSDPSETALSTTLQTGDYTAYLYNWTLEQDDGAGNFVPVPATLVSSYAVSFGIFNGTTTMISYQFRTDGVIVTVGSGALKVTASVDEITPVCTPFGAECTEGTWCPPTGLTGQRRACIAAGSIAVGQPCAAPTDCVANSSCFDLGAGPICADLCPSTLFDMDCPSGGTCQAAGNDYGICRPAAPPTPTPTP